MFDFITDCEDRKKMFTSAFNSIEELNAWSFLFTSDCCLGSVHPTLKAIKAKMLEQGTPKEEMVDSKFFFTINQMKKLREEGLEEYKKRYYNSFIKWLPVKKNIES